MKLVRFDSSHYDTLTKWWDKHQHPIISQKSLSPIGVITVLDSGEYVSASFLYVMAGCDLGQIAWTTTNPESSSRNRYDGINMCLDGLIDIAKKEKRTNVICFSSSSGLTKLIEKQGFKVGKSHDLLAGYFEV